MIAYLYHFAILQLKFSYDVIFKHSRFGPPNYQNVSKMAKGPKYKQKWSQNVSNQNVSILAPKYQNVSI